MSFRLSRIIILVSLLCSSFVWAQTSPLIMKHADSLAVARKRGFLNLQGRVHFVQDSIQFKTQEAHWNKNSDVVQCEGGFTFTHPNGYINARSGIYQKRAATATASGDVTAGDSAHTYYFTGDQLSYDREKEILTMPQKPKFYHFEKNKEGVEDTVTIVAKKIVYNKKEDIATADENAVITHKEVTVTAEHIKYNKEQELAEGHNNVTITHKDVKMSADHGTYNKKDDLAEGHDNVVVVMDSTTLSADHLTYNKKDDFATAYSNVKLTQNEMVVTCDTGYFDRKNNWISMKGNPTCELKNYHLTGDSIFLTLDSTGKSLRSALVIKNAHGIQREDAKKNSPGSITEAFGDTLYAQFSGNKIEQLYVNVNARGFFYETDLKEFRNLMDGDRLDLYFSKGKMDRAVVSGKAQSTYYYVKKDRTVSGKNEASGDTIHILFDAQKNAVKSLRLLGNSAMASGRYIDMEKYQRIKNESKLDTLSKPKHFKNMERIKELRQKNMTSSSSNFINSSSSTGNTLPKEKK
ncbi:MAG: LPS export ABC transporter periplasmic protein LptC [Fibrobacter sp.]|nr:LPS export ABC transporter periplasmic protein LptC [Fibrobacter sp.]